MAERVLVTGAGGFVAQHTIRAFHDAGFSVRATSRSHRELAHAESVTIGDIGPQTVWTDALRGVDVVVHLAGKAHVDLGNDEAALHAFHHVNVLGTKRLAESAASSGVRRFVLVSSVKVHGSSTPTGVLEEGSPLLADDPYGISKRESEFALVSALSGSSMSYVVVRPPLIYGPGVKANFLNLMSAVWKGLPIPVGSVQNRRSLLYVKNLADALIVCASHADAAGRTFLVSDGPSISTPDLVRAIAKALARRPFILPVPIPVLRALLSMVGKQAVADRLLESLEVDSSKIREVLRWLPPFTMDQGLSETASWYLRVKVP